MPAPMPAEAKLRVARKVQQLIKSEKKDPKQAFAMAMSMENAGRLSDTGAYERVKKRKEKPSDDYAVQADANEGADD